MKTEFERVDYWMFAGAGLMAVGTFLPILHLPIVGSINYLAGGRGDGIVVLILSAAIAGLIVFGKRKVAMLAALAALAVITVTFAKITGVFLEMSQKAGNVSQDNPFAVGLSKLAMASIGYGVGWLPLFAGALMVVIAGLSDMRGGWLVRLSDHASESDQPKYDPDEAVARYIERHKSAAPPKRPTPSRPTFGKRGKAAN
jgi:hypothetical protein